MQSPTLPGVAVDGGRRRPRSQLRPSHYALLGLVLLLIWVYNRPEPGPLPLSKLGKVPKKDAKNWGEFVAFGHARQKLLEETDPTYVGLGERGHFALGHVGKRVEEAEGGSNIMDTGKGGMTGNTGFDFERHGLYGGAHWDWTTGIAGLGSYLGPLDMRKRSASGRPRTSATVLDELQKASRQHYIDHAWEPPAEHDKPGIKERAEIEALTDEQRIFKKLSLRDRALGHEDRQAEAAEMWTRVYGAFHGYNRKGSVQIGLEKLVRKAPVVVFIEHEDARADRIRDVFSELRTKPDIFVVDLSKRRTSRRSSAHTWPDAHRLLCSGQAERRGLPRRHDRRGRLAQRRHRRPVHRRARRAGRARAGWQAGRPARSGWRDGVWHRLCCLIEPGTSERNVVDRTAPADWLGGLGRSSPPKFATSRCLLSPSSSSASSTPLIHLVWHQSVICWTFETLSLIHTRPFGRLKTSGDFGYWSRAAMASVLPMVKGVVESVNGTVTGSTASPNAGLLPGLSVTSLTVTILIGYVVFNILAQLVRVRRPI